MIGQLPVSRPSCFFIWEGCVCLCVLSIRVVASKAFGQEEWDQLRKVMMFTPRTQWRSSLWLPSDERCCCVHSPTTKRTCCLNVQVPFSVTQVSAVLDCLAFLRSRAFLRLNLMLSPSCLLLFSASRRWSRFSVTGMWRCVRVHVCVCCKHASLSILAVQQETV